ncbi:hypothetical protein [Nocardioides terrigena]|uniref:hypothetical protein n=1 Tax=Nocardioides terrigena TaxID=424797 RepID=UPI00131ED49C|nr:hypothetical protein [Nocardioides terrigena]
MSTHFATLRTLDLETGQAAGLGALGIHTIGDLLAFSPFRHARAVAAALEGSLRRHEVDVFLVARVHDLELDRVLDEPSTALRAVDTGLAPRLAALGLDSVGDLARYAPFDEAEDLVASYVDDYRDPDAPRLLVPQPRRFTRNSKSFVSFTKQRAVRGQDMVSDGGDAVLGNVFWFPDNQPPVIHLGHAVSFRQDWIFEGTHLGEPRGSVNLFMGQDTQVSVLDWRRAVTAVRTEDSTTAERLASTLFHQRAVDEVARATAQEHQFGATGSFGANAATSGSFVAAGALVGGVGGGATGTVVGLGIDALTGGATGGLGTLGGAVIGTAVGSMVGAAAGSLVTTGATTLGFVASDARGARTVMGRSAQDITQTTAQNSSSIRSFWSNIVAQNLEEEQQTVRTDRVTNHNRIHALNALYFEVLNDYRVTLTPTEVRGLLFLPFRPITFDRASLERYWWIIRTVLDDDDLVALLDLHFTTLTPAPSPGGPPVELPRIEEIRTGIVEVELNFDGSRMAEFIAGLAFPLAVFLRLVSGLSRDNITVELVTTGDDVELELIDSADDDPSFVGLYRAREVTAVHTITGIRVHNENDEFTVGLELGPIDASVDVNALHFEELTARLTVLDRASFSAALPDLGALEDDQRLGTETLTVGAQRSKLVRWNVGDRLREQSQAWSSCGPSRRRRPRRRPPSRPRSSTCSGSSTPRPSRSPAWCSRARSAPS